MQLKGKTKVANPDCQVNELHDSVMIMKQILATDAKTVFVLSVIYKQLS